jgi:hypothetical protein
MVLRLESVALAIAAIWLYTWHGGSWWLFAALILAPDLSAIGYAFGGAVGALAYNAAHAAVLPVALLGLGSLDHPLLIDIAIIWFVHIAVDRAVGYGLKYPEGFKETHLSRLGLG